MKSKITHLVQRGGSWTSQDASAEEQGGYTLYLRGQGRLIQSRHDGDNRLTFAYQASELC